MRSNEIEEEDIEVRIEILNKEESHKEENGKATGRAANVQNHGENGHNGEQNNR